MIRLNIFTHELPDYKIKRTYDSFIETFGKIPLTIYCDSPSDEYLEWLEKTFCTDVVLTKGLADGYIKSLESKEDYLFQLEHDWMFNNNINHSLKEIVGLMKDNGIYFFRFNKRQNIPQETGYQSATSFKEIKGKIPYCETDSMSNNPHIIDRKVYKGKFLPYLSRKTGGSFGIEENLKRRFISGTYGPARYRPTIRHIGDQTTVRQKVENLKAKYEKLK